MFPTPTVMRKLLPCSNLFNRGRRERPRERQREGGREVVTLRMKVT